MFKRLLLFLILFVISFIGKGQGNQFTFTSMTNPSNMGICGDARTFSVTIQNVSTTNYTNVTFTIDLPDGINYVVGSISGATESDVSNLNVPIFNIANFPAGSSITINYQGIATCAVNHLIINDLDILVNYRVDYTGNYDEANSNEFSIFVPALSYQSIINQTFIGNVGQVFTRTITIRNTGNAPLTSFTLRDTFGTGISIQNMVPGMFSVSGNVASLELSSTQFMTIGNNDGYFDPNEQIVITETIEIIACSNLTSEYGTYWGCNSQNCVINQETGNVVITSGNPNLVFTTLSNTINTCYDPLSSTVRTLRVTNTGSTPARNLTLRFFQSGTNVFSYYDASSFSYTVNGGSPNPITPTSIVNQNKTGAAASCLGVPNNTPLPHEVEFVIPIINPGEIVDITFTTLTCCPNTSCPITSALAMSWSYQGNYRDQCLSNTFIVPTTTPRSNMATSSPTTNVSGPSTATPGSTNSFCLGLPTGFGGWNVSNGGKFIVTVTLPPDFTHSGNPADISFVRGSNTWTPSNISISGSTLTIEFTYPHTLGGSTNGSELCINLTNTCGTGGTKTLTWNLAYQPNNSCSCVIRNLCNRTFSFSSTCPVPCATGGTSMYEYSMVRTNLGLPDANNDGLPDAGPYNMSVVRLDRAMMGDTVRQTVKAAFVNGTAGTTWQYVYFRTTIERANIINLTNIDRKVKIYDVSTGNIYNCSPTLVSTTNSGNNRIYLYSLNVNNLISSGCVPSGFVFENLDSVILELDYRVVANNGNGINTVNITNQMYASSTTDIVTHPGGSSCFNINGVYNWVGYGNNNYSLDYRTANGCNTVTLSQTFTFELGNTHNAFPGEFRNFAKFKQLTVNIPSGYSFISAQWRQNRGIGGGLGYTSQPFNPTTPVNPNSTTLVFNDINNVYPPLGTYQLSDDNFTINFEMVLRANCSVPANTLQPVAYTPVFEILGNNQTVAVARDSVLSNQPILVVQSTLPSIVAERDSVEWTVIVSNNGNVTANNTWLSPVNTSGQINIYEVEDVTATPTVITPVNNIYSFPNIPAGQSRTFKIKAKYTNCNKDSITVHAGWNCTGVPTNLASYSPCVSSKLKLYLQAIKPLFTVSINGPMAPVNLCEEINYEVTFTNSSDGRAYQPYVIVRRSNPGITFVPGSAEIMYPDGGTWEALADPLALSLNYIWDIGAKYPQFNTLGLNAAPDAPQNTFKIRFKMITNCSFVSGSFLRFRIQAKGGCGTTYNYNFNSPIITIAGAPTNYTTSITTQIDTVRNCGVPINYRVKIVNLGAGTTNPTDRIQIDLPQDFTYIPGSTTNIYQGFTTDPNITMVGLEQRLVWEITGGVIPGDSIIFNFQVMPSNSLTTGDYTNDIQTQLRVTLACGASTCLISNINGTLSKNTRVERPNGVWTGFVDTDWFNPYNWADCEIPTCADDVTIPDVANQPIISTAQHANTQTLFIQSNSSVTLDPNARINICGDLEVANNANFASGLNSEVHFTGSVDQTIDVDGTANFEHVYTEQTIPSNIYINQNLNIAQSLTLTQGVIVTGSNEVFVQNGQANSVNAGNVNAYVQGYLRRNVSENGIYYLPVGNASKGYELAEVRFNNRSDVNQLFSYFNDWPGAPYILNQADCNGILDQPALDHGYWTIDATFQSNIPSPVNYDLYLHNRSFTNPIAGWSIMKKPTGSPVTNFNILDGTCTTNPSVTLTRRFNMTSFSDFAVAQSSTPLPVEWLNLTATPQNNAIKIYWLTQTESNNAGFEIQKSIDGIHFVPLQFIAGAVNSNQIKEYQHYDFDVKPNQKYYYRLKQVDLNGDYQYSNVVEATLNDVKPIITIYPNPASNYIHITNNTEWKGKVKVQLFNIQGQLIQENIFENQNIVFSLQGIVSGKYLLRIESEDVYEVIKLIVN